MKYSGIYILLALHCKHFTTISDHFIAIDINLFDKTKILAIILKFHQKLWHKKQIFSSFWIFYIFVKILFENLRLINGHFKTILDHFFGSKVMVHYWVNIFLKCIICHLRTKSALIFSKQLIQRCNIPHFKAFGMSNFKYEVKIYQKRSILKAQWYKIVTTHLGDSDFIYNQQVAQVIQVGSKMGTVMMLQTIKSATLMGVIVVDQTSIHNIARNASALKIWIVLLH